tara:strand:+ start:9377 stop:10261 length:885 start_codon:yes stop_codon:yes gene_type:complete
VSITATLQQDSAADAASKASVSISQEWLVVDDGKGFLEITDAFSATGLPSIGSAYAKADGTGTLGYYVQSRSARRRSDSQVVISITYGIDPRSVPANPSNTNPHNVDAAQPGYCDVQVTARDVVKDLYRANATLPTTPLSVMTAITDGTAVDTGGSPTTFISRTWEVTVTIVDYPGNVPKLSTINPMINTRNSTAMWGAFSAHTGVLLPPRASRKSGSGLCELQLRWSFDQWYHLQQIPDIDPTTGRPKVDNYPNSSSALHAKPVYWVTDITDTENHLSLLTLQQNTLLTGVLS